MAIGDLSLLSQNTLEIGVGSESPPTLGPSSSSRIPSTRPPSSIAPEDRATDVPQLADPLIGMIVAERYRIVELIGRGGMGVVYRVEHARIGKLMALKLLTGELTRDAVQVGRFKREALMASRLSHPNTVQVFDFGASDALVYLAMEYLRGEDLGRIIRREGALGVERTAKIVIQICSSLAEAHEKGIVHRDLKPENIIIVRGHSGEEVVKVLDFGLAKLRESSELSDVTSRGAIVGTPYYMSPEQVRGEDVGPQGDVYSLGALMYACLTAHVVFDAPTPIAVLSKHLLEEPASPGERFPQLQIPKGISQIVMKALIKDPSKRIQSVQELQHLLIDELKREGQSSIEILLDKRNVQKLADVGSEAATRNEVEAYERTLRARGRFAWTLLAAAILGAGYVGIRLWQRMNAPLVFAGRELEPNDSAPEATPLPFGAEARGQLGRRIDRERSDRDFYRFSVPKDVATVALDVQGLPNMALCALLYSAGADSPFGRYCTGSVNQNLNIPALRLAAGDYLVGLMQDRDEYAEDVVPPVIENISDDYRLSVRAPKSTAGVEIEPNDFERFASTIAPGAELRGKLAWMRDVDVICTKVSMGGISFGVSDSAHPRPRTAVLQATPLAGPEQGIPVRIHRTGAKFDASPRDALGPWRSAIIALGAGSVACIELRLVPNPWAPTPHPLVAPAGDEEYVLRVFSH